MCSRLFMVWDNGWLSWDPLSSSATVPWLSWDLLISCLRPLARSLIVLLCRHCLLTVPFCTCPSFLGPFPYCSSHLERAPTPSGLAVLCSCLLAHWLSPLWWLSPLRSRFPDLPRTEGISPSSSFVLSVYPPSVPAGICHNKYSKYSLLLGLRTNHNPWVGPRIHWVLWNPLVIYNSP